MAATTEILNSDSDAVLAGHAAAICHLGRQTVENLIEIGARLTECKRICGHGNWLPWLEREFGWSEDTAENYMRVADLDKFRTVRNLDLPLKGLYLLAAPSTPAEARDAVIARAEAGEVLPVAEIKQTINAAKGRKRQPPNTEPIDAAQAAAMVDAEERNAKKNAEKIRVSLAAWFLADDDTRKSFMRIHRLQFIDDDARDAEKTQRGLVTGVKSAPHEERGRDCYETPPVVVRALLDVEPLSGTIWEPACGPGSIVRVLHAAGHRVVATDIESYGCPDALGGVDFLKQTSAPTGAQTILTNPPFMLADDFVRHALTLVPRVIMLLRLAFLESEGRSDILDGGKLARVHVFRNRLPMMHRKDWDGPKIDTGAVAFAWFVWDQDHSGPAQLARISWQPDAEPVSDFSDNAPRRSQPAGGAAP